MRTAAPFDRDRWAAAGRAALEERVERLTEPGILDEIARLHAKAKTHLRWALRLTVIAAIATAINVTIQAGRFWWGW